MPNFTKLIKSDQINVNIFCGKNNVKNIYLKYIKSNFVKIMNRLTKIRNNKSLL